MPERMTLAGKRIFLRPLAAADLLHGFRWESDAEVQHWAQGDKAPPDLTYAEYVARYAPPYNMPGMADHFVIVLRPGTVIGFVGYYHMDRVVGKTEVGIVIGEKACWSQGYGREAFRLLLAHLFADWGMQRVQLDTWGGNERAIRSYQAAGFQIEGRLRRAQKIDGAYYDTVLMGILREEFAAGATSNEQTSNEQ